MRSGDIKSLTLDHIDWAAETITYTQAKTRMPLRLPLTDEVGSALINYIKSVRPRTQYREVFLSLRPPAKPFAKNAHLYHIVTTGESWRTSILKPHNGRVCTHCGIACRRTC
jgi:integrase